MHTDPATAVPDFWIILLRDLIGTCPSCGAAPWKRCVTASGRWASGPHAERRRRMRAVEDGMARRKNNREVSDG